MLRLLACIFIGLAAVWSACVDKRNNVVKLDNVGNNDIFFTDGTAATYGKNGSPSCSKNTADVKLPGLVKLISGTITVNKKYNFAGSKALLTLTKNSWLIGTLCKEGVSQNPLVPDSDCQISICKVSNDLCNALGTVGVHKLGELEGDAGLNGTIVLPNLSSALKPLLRGQWKLEVFVQVSGQTVAHVKVPSNEDWLYIQE
jgi:hypothetical protein